MANSPRSTHSGSTHFSVVQMNTPPTGDHTWVMSPTPQTSMAALQDEEDPNFWASLQMIPRTQYALIGMNGKCGVCLNSMLEPTICTGCGKSGHSGCLELSFVQGYPFCKDCVSNFEREYQERQHRREVEQWKAEQGARLDRLKQDLVTTLMKATTVGTVAGGA